MTEPKKIKLELPKGMKLPENCALPEIEILAASIRRTIIQDDGKMVEVEQKIDFPKIEEDD